MLLKDKIKMNKLNKLKYISFFLSFLIIFSYFLGFYFNENSAGAGGYNGDISWILNNIKIFQENSLINSIFHKELFGNRPPLIYALNKIFNPYFYEYEKYRYTVFYLSLIGVYILYLGLKFKYNETNKSILFSLATLILLSPYYRTSGFWALNENYGLVATITSLTLINYFKANLTKNNISLTYIYALVFFSSLTVYFDQKLVLVPLISFFTIMFNPISYKIKISTIFLYIILSIPFLILIYYWQGIVPRLTQELNTNSILTLQRTSKLYYYNLGYTSTLLAFYLFPFIFLKNANFFSLLKNFFISKKNFILILIPLFYLLYLKQNYIFKDYTIDNYWIGFGYVHKFAKIFFNDIFYQEIFTYTAIFLSWLVICIYSERRIKCNLIILYFFLISLFFWPLMQEYFDPILLIVIILFADDDLKLNIKNILFLISYFGLFLIFANIYYYRLLN